MEDVEKLSSDGLNEGEKEAVIANNDCQENDATVTREMEDDGQGEEMREKALSRQSSIGRYSSSRTISLIFTYFQANFHCTICFRF